MTLPPSAGPDAQVVLGKNQYGKAGNHVVRITRDTARHEIEDLTVISQLHGDFESCHTKGDNSQVVATDTQKNTIFSFARDGVGSPEAFLLRLGQALHHPLSVGYGGPLGGGAEYVAAHPDRRPGARPRLRAEPHRQRARPCC